MEEVMSDERRKLLRLGLKTWVKCLHIDEVLYYLQQADVFDNNIANYVKNQQTIQQSRNELIRQLERRGNRAFVHFYHALIFSNQRSYARLLDGALNMEEKFGWKNVHYTQQCEALQEVNGNVAYEISRNKQTEETFFPGDNGNSCSSCVLPSAFTEHVNEPRGILDDLVVESVDNNLGNDLGALNFDEQKMYRNFSSPRGLALIINNCVFKTMPNRVGTDVDGRNLKNLFGQLGYIVVEHENQTAKGMLQKCQEFARQQEHAKSDSCIVCVLTHGENNQLYGVDDDYITVHDFVAQLNALNCPALEQKPKIFFLQACRGQLYDQGFSISTDKPDAFGGGCFGRSSSKVSVLKSATQFKLPIEADFLIAYATVPGYVSWRNNMRGSWFIQSICEVFAKFAKQSDLLEMLTLVNKRVAEVYESTRDSYKQMPECSTRLRRKFYFFPGISIPCASSSSV